MTRPSALSFFPRRRLLTCLALALAVCLPAVAQARSHHAQHKPQPLKAEMVIVAPADLPPASANIMPNGNFQTPAADHTHPAHWQQVDDLVWHWRKDPAAPARGKVICINTDVYQSQAYHWWADHFVKHVPLSRAPERRVPTGHKYNTIGGLDGGYYWSDYISIPPHAAVRVYVDAKGPASKVFIRGYTKRAPITFASEEPATEEMLDHARGKPHLDAKGRQIMHRLHFAYTTWFPVGGSKHWQTYTHSMPRHPNGQFTPKVRYIRIMLFPYWPAATYWYDNVRVVLVKSKHP